MKRGKSWGNAEEARGNKNPAMPWGLRDENCILLNEDCQSWGLSLNMAEVSVNSFRTSLYLGCIVGIIKVALLKTPSESLMDVVMQVNEFEQWIHNEYTNFGSSPVLSLNSSRARTSISASRLRFLSFEASTLSRSSSLDGILLFISLCIWLFGGKDTHYFPFHQMFGGISRHFFRHVSISKSEYCYLQWASTLM